MKTDIEKAVKTLDFYRGMLLEQLDCLDHAVMSLKDYDLMIDFAIEKGFKRVVDIGCSYGFQNELCRDRIDYVGIDEFLKLTPYIPINNGADVIYFHKHYPCEFSNFKNDIAISHLCLGWGCYKNSDDEFDKQFEALSKDFKASILYVPTEVKPILDKYFKNVEILEEEESDLIGVVPTAFYYCYN